VKWLISILLASTLWAGQSISVGVPTNNSITARTSTASTGIEFYLHDWGTVSDGLRTFEATFAGCIGLYSGTNLRILLNIDGGYVFDIPLALFVNKQMYVRIERDYAALTWRVEAWDELGVRQYNLTRTVTPSGSTSNGAYVNASANAGAMAFFRVYSTLVGANARPPVTFDNTTRLLEWKFDNSLVDSSGNGWTATAAPTYVTTPNQNVIAIPQVNPTAWSNQTSMRAGFDATLTGTSSYSQADSSNSVSCFWYPLDIPTNAPKPIIENQGSCSATFKNPVFGQYIWQLTVTDVTPISAVATITVGAVATDSKGIVIHANSAADDLFGPMIAFGQNPWGYADDTAWRGARLRSTTYEDFGVGTPNWKRTDLGTVTYAVGETHLATLTSAITSTQLTIPVSTLTGFDLTYPIVITLGNTAGSGEEVKICSNTGTTLNVCFDGRGYNQSNRRQAAFASGDRVYQRVANGTGTSFLSLYCPDGVGLEGSVTTTAGTVAPSLGSTTINGSSTGWTAGSLVGHTVHIVGAQGGIPFDYYANITANTTTQLTVDKAYPSGADAPGGSMSYSIVLLGRKSFVPKFTRSVGGEGYAEFNVTHCASNSKIYFNGGYEVYTGSHTNKTFGYMDTTAKWFVNAGNGSINYYGEDLANYALWLRSGLTLPLAAARYVADHWVEIPDLNEWAFGSFLVPQGRNAAMTGAYVRTILDTDGTTRLDQWAALRKAGQYAVTIPTKYAGDCVGGGDPRNIYYPVSWLGILAKHDPDTVSTAAPGGIPWKTYWQNQLANLYTFLDSCKGSGGFEIPFGFGGAANVTVSAGLTAVTGSGFDSSMCSTATGSGTATATNNSGQLTILTGTVPSSGSAKILVFGTRSGQYYAMSTGYSGTGPTLLGGLWPGDTDTVYWRTEADDNNVVISEAAVPNASTPMYLVACDYVSPTSLTLFRPYPGTSGNRWRSRSNVLGYGQQPFFAGISTFSNRYATKGATGSTATNFQTMTTNVANWVKNNGYDPVTKGLLYANVTPMCDPILADANPSVVLYRNVGCNYTSNSGGKGASRELLAEAQTAFTEIYQADPSPANLAIGDDAYASLYGQSYCGAATCGDGVGNEKSYDNALDFGKWYGFQFGIGMAHQWAAVRQGGVTAPVLVAKPIAPRLADISGAVDIVVDYLAPSGLITSSSPCTSAACTVDVNTVQGTYQYRVRYRNGSAVNLSVGKWTPVR